MMLHCRTSQVLLLLLLLIQCSHIAKIAPACRGAALIAAAAFLVAVAASLNP